MKTNAKPSLIVTTYNRPDALDQVLRSINAQQIMPLEVLIADDGSGDKTRDCVAKWQAEFRCPLHHVWQDDNGFRAAHIRNKAAAKSVGNYLIFVDGDCILRPDFIRRHMQLAQPGYFAAGNRVLLSEVFTEEVLAKNLPVEHWPASQFTVDQLNRRWTLRYLMLGPLRKQGASNWQGVKTCNLGVWADAFRKINGFDEAFLGWGYEDSDLVIRLLRAGQKRLNARFATTVLHLWHRENDRSQEQENWLRLQQVIESGKTVAECGLDQYLLPDQ